MVMKIEIEAFVLWYCAVW